MTAIEQIIAIAEQLGWQVKTDTDKPNLVVFDFQQYTPHGQDFSFSVEMKGNDTDSLLQEVETYYEDFDPDYEAYLWIGTDGHGKNGAPYRIKDIVSDMEQAEAMIEKLYETLKTTMQFPTAKARTAGKERRLKFYEMPQSAIAESLRQILSGVAKRYLTRCSFAVPLLRKNRPWR